ncbi:hypothetical protein [Clostridium sp. BNL1100]|uniref:hypothetical protein n=1 Tax=Clostridium sp. BNL1100 TaxID=755731 RepID=UPI00024A7A67|nr:hypothetical protein [Clostridium sp. BNL1100]AEY66125.1 hypothetical protein Clo1100_1930 [Clostridium sp. BNL1100]
MNIKSEKKKILKTIYPPITSYPTHANILSTALINDESIIWFYDYYIQLFAGKDLSENCYVDFFAPIAWKCCPWIHYQRINREFIENKWSSICEFLVDSIDSGYYAFLYLNQFYISDFPWAYQSKNFMHDTYVFGYDAQEEVFYTADFYKHKYGHAKVNFTEMEKAFSTTNLSNINDFLQGIVLVAPVKYEKYNFNIKRTISFINDFLNSETGLKSYTDGYRHDVEQNSTEFCFGMDVYKLLEDFLTLLSCGNSCKDYRPFNVLVDHKTLMLMRIEYLGVNGYLKNWKNIYMKYEVIRKNTITLHNIILKIFVSGNMGKIENAINLIRQIAVDEKVALEMIIENSS